MRICRYTDTGMYIQGHDVDDIDRQEFIKYKGALKKAYDEIKNLIPEPKIFEG